MKLQDVSYLPSVAKVMGPRDTELNQATVVYFVCPCLSTKGIVVNKDETGFSAKFVDRLSGFTKDRIVRTVQFEATVGHKGWVCEPVAIWGSADAYILYSQIDYPAPVADALLPRVMGNHESVQANISEFWRFYETQPWIAAPSWAVTQEEKRLLAILPPDAPKKLRQDFVRRVFAGFALDGWLLRQGFFGPNPIILGVESPGVAVLQNAALPRELQIPVIQLR